MFPLFKKKDKKGGMSGQDSDVNEFGVKLDKGPSDKELEAELKGLTGIDSLPEDDFNLKGGEDDVESELERLMGRKGTKQPKRPPPSNEPLLDISQITADIELEDEDGEEEEIDENDEELLGELLKLSNLDETEIEEAEVESDPVEEKEDTSSSGDSEIMKTLKERLKMYKEAEMKAKENKESSRARRFARGIKTLENLLKNAKKGKTVSPGDIPPVIALNLKPAPPPSEAQGDANEALSDDPPADVQNSVAPSDDSNMMKTLRERLLLYQTAERRANANNDTVKTRRYSEGIRMLEDLIKQGLDGKQIAPDDIPPVVHFSPESEPSAQTEPLHEENETEDEKNVIDLLYERLQMYKTAEAKAVEREETSRARRFDRGIRKLQDLINQATTGKVIKPEEIPPVIALNLKPAPPVIVKEDEIEQEENLSAPSIERENLVKSSDAPYPAPLKFTAVDDVDLDELQDEEAPATVLEGLEQRVRLYSKFQEEARRDGDTGLAAQNARIVRVYEKAISIIKNGGYVDVLSLPNPRKCPAIPIPIHVP